MMCPCWQKVLCSMREGDMPQIVAECSHADDRTPVLVFRIGGISGRKDLTEPPGGTPVLSADENVEHPAGEIHHPETVLEPFVCCSGIDQPRECKLVNVAESLKGAGVDNLPLI